MNKTFNVNGICYPDENYMVDLGERLKEIKVLVDKGEYFVINRARQYGKTTTLWALNKYLQDEYAVIFLSFQRISAAKFENEAVFSAAFAKLLLKVVKNKEMAVKGLNENALHALEEAAWNEHRKLDLVELFEYLSELCATAERPVILIIDEVDSAANNQVFLNFLAQLRDFYLYRRVTPTFHSVILAGVYDIKNLKLRIRPDESHRYNSPWNIAADFDVDMSFSAKDIAGMLKEYETDYQTGMQVSDIAEAIYEYTSGYPYLVSRICKLLDEKIAGQPDFADRSAAWTKAGFLEAVKQILNEPNTLFDDMRKKISDYPELRNLLFSILFYGQTIPFNQDNYAIDIGTMFGFIKKVNGNVAVANRIFETRLYNLFMSEELVNNQTYNAALQERNQFIQNGYLNMDLVLQKFVVHFSEVYDGSDIKFVEENGRRLFLLYLKPIINGTGNYYIEARTRDLRRTDVIVDYRGKQYVIEMKIWHGNEYNKRGEEQLAGYLDDYHLTRGYLLSFNFNKNKEVGVKEIFCNGKTIVEATV